jgi:hypothetical protein
MRRSGAVALLAVAFALAPAAARGDVAGCRQVYESQRYEQAAAACAEVAADPAATRRDLTTAWEVIGMANLVLGRTSVARAAFCQALAADPRYRPTDPIYPARFVAVFESVRQAGCTPPVRLDVEPEQRGGVVAAMRVRVAGAAPEGSQAVVWYRHPGEGRWRRAAAAVQDGVSAVDLPRLDLRQRELEYYVTLTTANAQTVARAGTPDYARRLLLFGVTPGGGGAGGGEARPLWRRSWVWWTAGGVVLTTVVVSVALAARGGGGAPHGSFGTVRLP